MEGLAKEKGPNRNRTHVGPGNNHLLSLNPDQVRTIQRNRRAQQVVNDDDSDEYIEFQ